MATFFLTTTTTTCTVHFPSWTAWRYAVTIHVLCCVLGALPLGVLTYYYYALPPRQRRHSEQEQGRVVVGVALGAAAATFIAVYKHDLAASVWYNNDDDDDNDDNDTVMLWMGRFLLSTVGFSCFFKALAAAHGHYPVGADADPYTWFLWFVCLPEPIFAKGKLRSTTIRKNQVFQRGCDFAIKLVALSCLVSVLQSTPHCTLMDALFPASTTTTTTTSIAWSTTWLRTIINGFGHIWLLYLFAAFCLDFSALGNTVLTGVHMEPGFMNPLLQSRSLTQAWGTRWNKPVQLLLQRSVYTPLRQRGWRRSTAALATFIASGWLHEYNFYVHNAPHYEPGHATLFFVLMGLCMLGEEAAFQRFLPRSVQRAAGHVPTVIISVLWTLVAAGPFEMYFIKSWMDAGWVHVIGQLLPSISCQGTS